MTIGSLSFFETKEKSPENKTTLDGTERQAYLIGTRSWARRLWRAPLLHLEWDGMDQMKLNER